MRQKLVGQRLAWPDATRALGVFAVVLFHVLIWNHVEIAQGTSPLTGFWDKTDAALSRLRMPVLFALSGLLASRSLLAGTMWPAVQRRLVSNYYLYAVWLLIYTGAFAVMQVVQFPHVVTGLTDMAVQLLVPDTTLWFIFALAVYPCGVFLFRVAKAPTWLVLAIATGIWFTAPILHLPGFTEKIVQNFVFFAFGVYCANWLRSLADATWKLAAAVCMIFIGLTVLGLGVPPTFEDAATFLGSLSAVPASIAVTAKLCAWRPFAAVGSFIGTRTLAIYVLHPLLLAGLSIVLAHTAGLVRPLVATSVGDGLYPLVVTGVVMGAALFLDSGMRKIPGNVLLEAPGTFLKGRTDKAISR